MKLIRETLTNFMGHRSLTFEPNGHNADILGDNGVGKTTVKSAFLWVFTDKDAEGKEAEGKGFKLKTLVDGSPIPMIDHSVELVLEEKGKRFTLKKTLKESWVKTRGTATQEFKGHVNTFEIDGIPKTKKEFDLFISRLCDDSLLRILTDIDYFPNKMKWEDRRRILLDMCGDISDADVISSTVTVSNKALNDLLPVLNAGRSIEDHRKVITAQKAKLNSEIEMIPVRIDEATRALPDVSGLNAESLSAELEKARSELQAAESKLLDLSQGGAITEKRLRIRTIESEILTFKNKELAARQDGIRAKSHELNGLNVKKNELTRKQSDAEAQIRQLKADIERLEMQIFAKRESFTAIAAVQFDLGTDEQTVCPACGQNLPEEQVQAAREKALENFNLQQSQKKTQIRADGIALVDHQKSLKESLDTLEKSLPDIERSIGELEPKIKALTAEIYEKQSANDAESPEIVAMRGEITTLESEIKTLESDVGPEKEKLTAERDKWRLVISGIESDIAKIAQAESGTKRITELRDKQKELSREYEALDRQTFLTEEFIRAKVGLMESRINSKFKIARFKMFETQINGALNEICEVVGNDGAPYSKGLNTAARINIGIDIVNTLSEHFGVTIPIFVDNAEAVTQIIDTESQLIRLIKPEIRSEADRKKYGKLVVETDGE